MTRFTLSSAKVKASKYAVFFIVLGTSFFWNASAQADNTWQASNGNVVGNTVQFDYRGGSATYTGNVTDGSTVNIVVNNMIANCIGNCTPIPDIWTVSINGQSYSGNIIEIRTLTAQVSGQLTIAATGRDVGFWGGWYGPIITVSIVSPAPLPEPSPTPTVVVDSPTVIVSDTPTVIQETATVFSISDTGTQVLDTPTSIVESQTSIVPSDSPTVLLSDTQTSLIVTSESSTQTNQQETPTVLVTPSEPTPSQPEPSVPTPPAIVEPQPQPVPVEPSPLAPAEPAPPLAEEVPEEAPVPAEEPPAVEEEPPPVEEPPPAEEPLPPPVEEDAPDVLDEEPVQEQPELTPEPSVEPVVKPEPTSLPDISSQPQSIHDVNLESIAPDTPIELDNGVVLTAEVVVALQLLENPAELLAEIFSDPAQVLIALSNIGADMAPEVREKSEKVVLSAIIAGNIATQAAATAAGVAAYRRKP